VDSVQLALDFVHSRLEPSVYLGVVRVLAASSDAGNASAEREGFEPSVGF
jgi:hypothetical protein